MSYYMSTADDDCYIMCHSPLYLDGDTMKLLYCIGDSAEYLTCHHHNVMSAASVRPLSHVTAASGVGTTVRQYLVT